MQKVLTADQMREVDRLTTERYGIPSILLMENAAHAVARVITEKLGGSVAGKATLILCGKGNNGGDGAALARLLWNEGAFIRLLLFGKASETKGDAATNLEILSRLDHAAVTSGGEFNKFIVHDADEDLMAQLEAALQPGRVEIVIDALFGTGLTRELSGQYSEVIQRLQNHQPSIVSIDLPSGFDADLGRPIGPHVSAAATVTFTAPKAANVVPPGASFNGELIVANIGSPRELIDDQPSQLFLAERSDAIVWLAKSAYSTDSYKNKRGHALVIAGSANYSGAGVLAANAAMRSGVGLVTLACPASAKVEIASRLLPEVILSAVESDEFASHLAKADAVAVGCGLEANNAEVEKLVREIVETRTKPVIVDATALTFLSPVARPLQKSEREQVRYTQRSDTARAHARVSAMACDIRPPLILTPHEGEFNRMRGTTDKEAIADRVAAVRDFAAKHEVILVLKGERVLIGEPGGKVVVNPTGNPGLGKAGNGDTLAGILAGFVAQGAKMNVDIFETVVAAVYVAGLAGDIAERKYGKRVMTASDVRECLAEAFDELVKDSQPGITDRA